MNVADFCDNRAALLVTSPSSLVAAQDRLARVQVEATELVTSVDWQAIRDPGDAVSGIQLVVGFGAGRVMDVARLRGAQLSLEVVCIPTFLSTDAFLASSVAIRQRGRVRYLSAEPASTVILDEVLLLQSPARLHALGCSDVLSILTASEDWRRDDGDSDSASAIAAGLSICESLLLAEAEIAAGTASGLHSVFSALEAEVSLCASYGSDRLEEGSEHYFACGLEQRATGIMHGGLVGLGILVSRQLQGYPIERLQRFMLNTGIAAAWRAVSLSGVVETLLRMPAFVVEEGYPASVWNSASLTEAQAARLCDRVLRR